MIRTLKYPVILFFILMVAYNCSHDKKTSSYDSPGYFTDSVFTHLEKIKIEKRAAYIDGIFKKLSKKNWFNGCVMYAEKGRLVYTGVFGYSDFRKKDSLKTTSSFQLASVSKMFTAMSVMILKEEGKLSWNDSIQIFIPEFPYHGVTIRQLLTHRSGLSRYMSLAHEKWDKHFPLTNEDVIELYVKYQPSPYFRPDQGFHYCNTNYVLLASVVERISGQTFDLFVKERIFDPLGMDHSFIYNMNGDTSIPAYITPGVPGYYYRRWRLVKERNEYLNGVMGDKGVYSNVEDLYKWDQALYNNTLVGDSTLRLAFTPGSPSYWKRKDDYGFGWRIRKSEDSTVYHYGWWKGFRNFYIRDMKQEKTIIVLTNKDKGPGSSYLWNILHDHTYDLGPVSNILSIPETEN